MSDIPDDLAAAIERGDAFSALYGTVTEGYQAGKRAGMEDAFHSAIARLGWLSLKYEKENNTAAFHAAEACCADIRKLRDIMRAEMERDKTGLRS